ncbi:polysaccharide deacetylase family protein [Rubrivivax gelatinosus]|uniref:polysaccharide deacetylase family protein n=1 Tax=Rubrivivax gelatinosus TaxID=28068 RepID=UPI001903C5D2
MSAVAERVPVLMYHRVDARGSGAERGYCVTPQEFGAHLDWLAAAGWTPCTLADFGRWQRAQGTLPERSVLITFDDGFAGLHAHVLPLLAARRWPATVFLVSARIGGRDDWATREFRSVGAHALLDAAQIAEMAAQGIEFHSHTRSHADLMALDDAALAAQLRGSRDELEQLLGRRVDAVAYPYGRTDARVQEAARAAGYRLGFSVEPGFNRPGGDALRLRRLDITGHDVGARFGRKLTLGSNDGSFAAQARYVLGRIAARF